MIQTHSFVYYAGVYVGNSNVRWTRLLLDWSLEYNNIWVEQSDMHWCRTSVRHVGTLHCIQSYSWLQSSTKAMLTAHSRDYIFVIFLLLSIRCPMSIAWSWFGRSLLIVKFYINFVLHSFIHLFHSDTMVHKQANRQTGTRTGRHTITDRQTS